MSLIKFAITLHPPSSTAPTLPQVQHEDRDQHQPGIEEPGFRVHHALPGPEVARATPGHRRQHRPRHQAAQALGPARRCDRPGRRQGQLPHRRAATDRGRQRPPAQDRHARSGDHRGAAGGHLPRVGGAPHPDRAGPLLRQRQRAVLLRHVELQAGDVDVGVHREPAVRRPAAAARRAQAADLAGRAGPVCQRRALRVRLDAAAGDPGRAAQAVDALRSRQGDAEGHHGGGAGARTRRFRPRGAGRQDDHHQQRQRRAPRALQGQRRQHGDRRLAGACRPCARPRDARRDDPRGHRQGAGRHPRGRHPGDHHRAADGAAHPLPERLQARQPLRLRDPPAVAGVLQDHQADRDAVARVAAAADGLARKGHGLRAAVRLLARSKASSRRPASRPKAG